MGVTGFTVFQFEMYNHLFKVLIECIILFKYVFRGEEMRVLVQRRRRLNTFGKMSAQTAV